MYKIMLVTLCVLSAACAKQDAIKDLKEDVLSIEKRINTLQTDIDDLKITLKKLNAHFLLIANQYSNAQQILDSLQKELNREWLYNELAKHNYQLSYLAKEIDYVEYQLSTLMVGK